MTFGLGIGLGITIGGGGSGGGGATTVRRAIAYGTNASYVKDTSNAAQWSFLKRKPYFLPQDIKAGDLIEFAFPLWTLERPGSNPVAETDLPEAYDFMFAMEYPFNLSATSSPTLANRTRCLNTRDGLATYSYTVGQADRMMVFTCTAPVDIPAMSPIGGLLLHECVAGRSGAVTNKAINSTVNASNYIGRFEGAVNTTTSQVGTDATMTRTTFTAASAAQTGTPGSMLVGSIRVAVPTTFPVLLSMGNSKLAGANEGTSFSGTNALPPVYGDSGGDQYGNTGWGTRLALNLDIGCVQMSRGSDSFNYHLVSGVTRRMEFAAWCNPTHMLPPDPHNDTNQTGVSDWAATTAYSVDDTCKIGSNFYVCDVAGTSGAVGPSGTGANISDGTVRWTYIGPQDMTTTTGAALAAKMRKMYKVYKAAMPSVKIIAPTLTPDAASSAVASAYSYDSGTGALTLTIPDASKLSVGGNVRVAGLTPSGLNTSGVTNTAITAISGNDITVTRPTGLAAPTGTATVGLTWTDPSYQTPNTGYAANNSFRAWINRFLRTNPNNALDMAALADAGKWGEAGNPTTPAAETGAWAALPVSGPSLGSAFTSDGTHETSYGNNYIAERLSTQEAALVAVLQSVN